MKFFLRNTFILLIIFSACKPSRHISRKNTPANQPLPNLTAEEIIQKVNEAYFNFDELSGKAQLTVGNGEKEFSFTMFLRMKHDSIIWINFNALGTIELARMKMTRDSVWVIDRFHKKAYIKSFSSLGEMLSDSLASDSVSISFLNMWINDFGFLQDLLIGNMKIPNNIIEGGYLDNTEKLYSIYTDKDSIKTEYYLNVAYWKIQEWHLTNRREQRLDSYDLVYEDYKQINDSFVPLKESFFYYDYSNPDNKTDAPRFVVPKFSLKISYSKLEIPKEKLNYPFIIPSDYEIIR